MTPSRFALAAPAQLTQEIRKSKFAANAANVASPTAAAELLERVSDRSATHNCWAWRIGQQYRFNDDGEPAGTAGKPILQAIDGQSLDNVIVVVTRWFGGIKLGAGGLVRAYGGCAAECLRQAPKVVLIKRVLAAFTVGFAEIALLRARLRAYEAEIETEEFSANGVDVRASVPAIRIDELRLLLADITRGRGKLHIIT